ncbi:MAG: UpxY family transcription antiterminator [Balneolaceae bacterium]|nr:UpxY family transcription antiterminator [Balneolaceae bacterium]
MPWLAFHTKSRHEFKALDQIKALNSTHQVYCPSITQQTKWSDRWKEVKKPLIPGYIFVNTSLKDRVSLLELPSISRSVLTSERKIATIKEQEIDQIKHILDEIESDSVQVFNQGDTVYVESGMFQQASGTVLKQKKTRVIVHLTSLDMTIQVSLHPNRLKKVAKP